MNWVLSRLLQEYALRRDSSSSGLRGAFHQADSRKLTQARGGSNQTLILAKTRVLSVVFLVKWGFEAGGHLWAFGVLNPGSLTIFAGEEIVWLIAKQG